MLAGIISSIARYARYALVRKSFDVAIKFAASTVTTVTTNLVISYSCFVEYEITIPGVP